MDSVSRQLLMSGGLDTVGQQTFTVAGTQSWTCPPGVTSVCVVAIGPGANGYSMQGGGGGGLGYKNNIAVTPGSTYTVVVGAADSGVDSYFMNSTTVKGGAATGRTGGGYAGDGGGNGGTGAQAGSPYTVEGYSIYNGGGGGGSGGYTGLGGSGGAGRSTGNYTSGMSGSLGAGGTQGGSGAFCATAGTPFDGAGSGGYASLYGTVTRMGNTSSSTNGASASSTHYGAGGGGNTYYMQANVPGTGGKGAVRIIWGEGRAFPSTNVQDM